MSKKKSMRYGSHQYYVEKKKALIKEEAKLSYRDKVKVYLSFTLEELEAMDHPLYEIIKKEYPKFPKNATLDEARMTKMFEKIIKEGSNKTLELSYKLDGSMSDLTNEPDFDEIDIATEGIK